jgi:hypothetical protein
MDSVLLARIEHNLNEQLKCAVEDIIGSVFESVLDVDDYDVHYDVAYDAMEALGGDVNELSENIAAIVMEGFEKKLALTTGFLVLEFQNHILPSIIETYEQDGEVDIPARRQAWCNWIDSLNKDGRLSEYEAANIDANVDSL